MMRNRMYYGPDVPKARRKLRNGWRVVPKGKRWAQAFRHRHRGPTITRSGWYATTGGWNETR